MYHYESCGLKNVWLVNGYTQKNTKFGEGVAISDIDGLHEFLGRTIIGASRPLAPEEFRFLRVELGLSQKRLGNLLDVSEQTVANYEKGNHHIPRPSDVGLRSLYRQSVDGKDGFASKLEELAELDNEIHRLQQELDQCEKVAYSEQQGWHLQESA